MGFRRTERSSPGSDRCTRRGSTPGRVLVLSAQVTAGALNPRPTSPSPTTGPSAVCWDEASQKPSTAFSSSRTYSESQTTASNQNAGASAKRPSARPRPSQALRDPAPASELISQGTHSARFPLFPPRCHVCCCRSLQCHPCCLPLPSPPEICSVGRAPPHSPPWEHHVLRRPVRTVPLCLEKPRATLQWALGRESGPHRAL